MKLSLLQMDVQLGRPEENRRKAASLVAQAAGQGADVAVLPETWNLGFFPKENLAGLAEPDGGESRALLSSLAAQHHINLVGGSLVTRRGDRVYNTAYVFDREGRQVARYDKIHGFSPSGEHAYFQHGDRLCTFSLDGVKMGIIICYDLRFCELARSLALQGIQLLFVPAQWPHPRLGHWQILNQARAIENQMYVACVNGCGRAGELSFCGHSMLVDPLGRVAVQAGEEEAVLTGTADFSQLEDIRSRINVFRDRRPALYRLDG